MPPRIFVRKLAVAPGIRPRPPKNRSKQHRQIPVLGPRVSFLRSVLAFSYLILWGVGGDSPELQLIFGQTLGGSFLRLPIKIELKIGRFLQRHFFSELL